MADDLPPAPPSSSDEDREYSEWLNKRKGKADNPPTAEFMEMVRQAASRYQPPAEGSTPVEYVFDSYDLTGEPSEPVEEPVLTVVKSIPPDAAASNPPPYVGSPYYTPPTAASTQTAQPTPRRRKQRGSYTLGVFAGILRTLIIIIFAAGLTATIFTWFTPSGFITSDVRQSLSAAMAADQTATAPAVASTPNWARRIGIVSGHRGPQNDPGAVCPDGLTEAEINFNVAQLVVRGLQERGYTTIDLLDEFDPRLDGYQATALVSIHANTCQDFGEVVSGFLISTASARAGGGRDDILVDCIAQNYAVASGLERRLGLTIDMTDYHTFREIHFNTPAAIIELGFLRADRELLTGRPDALAQGIVDGILCFLEPGVAPPPLSGTPSA